MKWYIGNDIRNAVNYYKRLLSGMLGKIKWFVLADEKALVIVPENITVNIGKEDEYSLIYDKEWESMKLKTKNIRLILIEEDNITIAFNKEEK